MVNGETLFHKFRPGETKKKKIEVFYWILGPKHIKARKLVNIWTCQEIIVFLN